MFLQGKYILECWIDTSKQSHQKNCRSRKAAALLIAYRMVWDEVVAHHLCLGALALWQCPAIAWDTAVPGVCVEAHWALPLAVAPASQALQRGGLARQSKSAVGLCSLTLVFFLVPISRCHGLQLPELGVALPQSAFDTAFSQCLL